MAQADYLIESRKVIDDSDDDDEPIIVYVLQVAD